MRFSLASPVFRVLFLAVIAALLPVRPFAQPDGLAQRVAQLESQVAALTAVLQYVHVEEGFLNDLTGPHFIIEGANVHVRSGSGDTRDGCEVTPAMISADSAT